ncbi:MAG TPA: ATP-binding protein, partial [Azospirillaceae bacterium]|nr:ATP-binding protein [Azospirillaceae bacterium]
AYDHIGAAERRAAAGAAELAQDRERLRALLESSPVGVCAFDSANRAIFSNTRLNVMLGLPGDRLAGVALDEMLADAESDSWISRWVRERQPVRDVEICLRRADGATFWALFNADVAQLDGRTVYLAWIYDIDRRKSAERKLAEARDMAEAATAAKSTFLATMAHEIRTPMNGVLGMLELLERTRLDSRQGDIVATIRDSAAALLSIVNDVLDYSKIEAGRMELEQAPVGLGALAENVCEMLGPAARAKGLRLTCHVDPGLPPAVLADQVRLRQILFNLAGNAVKFTQQGGVHVRAFPQAQGDGWVRVAFEVADTGIGIAPETLSRLFAPFAQAEPSIARRFGGSGLGLSITRRLVDLMRGDISVDSVPGRGSTFRIVVTFDVAAAPALDAFGRPTPPDPRLKGLKLLAASPILSELSAVVDYLA